MKEIKVSLESKKETSIQVPEGPSIVLKFDEATILSGIILRMDLSKSSVGRSLKFENLRMAGTNLVVFQGCSGPLDIETSGCQFESFFSGELQIRFQSAPIRNGRISLSMGSTNISLKPNLPKHIGIDDFNSRKSINGKTSTSELNRLLESLNSDIKFEEKTKSETSRVEVTQSFGAFTNVFKGPVNFIDNSTKPSQDSWLGK